MLGPAGVGEGARPGTLLVDLSTGPPALARRLAAELNGYDVLDAPCNNLVAGATMAAVAEACALAEHEGLEPATLYEIMCASRAFEPLFALDLIAKDPALALALAAEPGCPPRSRQQPSPATATVSVSAPAASTTRP